MLSKAGIERRIANFIVDSAVVLGLLHLLTTLATSLESEFLIRFVFGYGPLAFYSIFFVYYFAMESSLNLTIGKLVTKTRVSNINGGKLKKRQVLRRTLLRLIPLEPVSFMFSIELGLHDKYSLTTVVRKN